MYDFKRFINVIAMSLSIAVVAIAGLPGLAGAQNTPPDLAVCNGVDACDAPSMTCTAGHQVTLTGFIPGSTANSGTATYTYEVCSPPAGTCTGNVRFGQSCLDNDFCQKQGRDTDPTAICERVCAQDNFRGLSHFDVTFPALGASCLGANTEVTGSCTNGNFVLGDNSCFAGGSPVAKCDNTNLNPGQCLTMTVNIAGETTSLGLGAAVVVDKEANTCTSACMSGPSCDRCGGPPEEEDGLCLTRTIGFWGTHPWITNDFDPVTVCGKPLECTGADNGKSNPSCQIGTCDSVMEGLGSIPSELSNNQPYVSMVKQLTAAKLNLNATAALLNRETCSSFRYPDKNGIQLSIQDWIAQCDAPAMCGASKQDISGSGCIEALNAFNNSEDVLTADGTPPPFDRPSVDDAGNVSGADPSGFTGAQRNKTVIGKNIAGGGQCQ